MWVSSSGLRHNVGVHTGAEFPMRAQTFRVSREGRLMPASPEPSSEVAYPRHIITDGRPTEERSLSSRFFEHNAAHLIGRRTGTGVWPDDPQDVEAVRLFERGQ